jgi:DNA-binding PadR family transcriptional regulator
LLREPYIPLLTRLKNDGLLNYRWEESTSGPPRKYYGLTEIGQTFKELNGTWTELSDAKPITNQNTNHEQNCKYKLRRNVLPYR